MSPKDTVAATRHDAAAEMPSETMFKRGAVKMEELITARLGELVAAADGWAKAHPLPAGELSKRIEDIRLLAIALRMAHQAAPRPGETLLEVYVLHRLRDALAEAAGAPQIAPRSPDQG